MDPTTPQDELTLVATSRSEDLGILALADLAEIFESAENQARLIGGHMVTLHAQRWRLGQELYRETHDADLGVTRMLAKQSSPVETLLKKGYTKTSSNRLVRTIGDAKDGNDNEILIDVLVPALRTRARQSVRVGDLQTTEVPGLADAFLRNPVIVELIMHRLNGDKLRSAVALPDEASALVLKTLAWRQRLAAKDAVDMWRCLEIAHAAGLHPDSFTSSDSHAAKVILMESFAKLTSSAMAALTREQNLAPEAAAERHTRIRAVTKKVLGS